MAVLEILEYPDPRLRTKAKPVTVVDDAIRRLAADMLETMYAANGIGLAATQVDVHKQVIVMDLSEERNRPMVFINPEITVFDGGKRPYEEGCLSVPGFHEEVQRPENVLLKALDLDGNPVEIRPDGLLAVCIQHEIDHLNGKLFVDYLSALKRQRIRSKLEKEHRKRA
jgi:peptide deformylase